MARDEFEIRTSGELRVEARGTATVIRGYAIVFDRLSENLGGFREIIKPEAIDRTLREGVDLRALVDHDSSRLIGRLSAGTLRVAKDAQGLRIEIDPPDTTVGHDIVESIRRRDTTGMSFAFRTLEDAWDSKTDPPTRLVTDMLVREISAVTFPAYPTTEVALRSLSRHRPAGRTPSVQELREAAERRRSAWRPLQGGPR